MSKRSLLHKSALALMLSTCAACVMAQVFTIRDIRVEGIQRTEPGTVFSHLPFRVGDEYTPERGSEAIHSLYSSGLFRDVSLSYEDDVLIVTITERPAIASIEANGAKAIEKEALEKQLRQIGLSEGRIFDKSMLDRAEQDLRRMYLSKGFYGTTVTASTSPVERNRLRVTINIDEGASSSIKQIRFVGNHIFDDDDLLDEMQLQPHMWLSWYNRKDQYAREKLAADLESIRSFYMNRGYLDFKIDSTQVSVAPNKSDVFITVNMTEGKLYNINKVSLAGDVLGLEREIEPLLKLEQGEIYNAEKVNAVAKAITERFTALGYAFCSTTPNPISNSDAQTVDIVFSVDPGRRAYVRNVNISGNNITRDAVIRREVRQYESSWFDSDKIKASRDRIDRLGFFETVEIDHKPVEGTNDQVDLEVKVKERATGSISLGAGYSSDEGIVLSGGLSQNNIFGTGNAFSLEINTSTAQRTISTSLTQPYITPEGVSRSWELYDRKTDLEELEITNVAYETIGAGLNYGIPISELDTVYLGGRAEMTKVSLRGTQMGAYFDYSDTRTNSPYRYWNFVDEYGKKPKAALLTLGWSRDSRDNVLAPTRGRFQHLSAEASLPLLDLKYYRATYQFTQYVPLSKHFTLGMNLQLGYGDSYGKKDFPFFKNFYAGGIGSVRGYESSTLGPRDTNGDNLGGDRQLLFSTELLTPLPGMDKTLRGLVFFDGGYVWGYQGTRNPDTLSIDYERQKLRLSDLRYSWGFGIAWISPMGPLKFSLAFPINKKEGDKTERFQFTIGTGF